MNTDPKHGIVPGASVKGVRDKPSRPPGFAYAVDEDAPNPTARGYWRWWRVLAWVGSLVFLVAMVLVLAYFRAPVEVVAFAGITWTLCYAALLLHIAFRPAPKARRDGLDVSTDGPVNLTLIRVVLFFVVLLIGLMIALVG